MEEEAQTETPIKSPLTKWILIGIIILIIGVAVLFIINQVRFNKFCEEYHLASMQHNLYLPKCTLSCPIMPKDNISSPYNAYNLDESCTDYCFTLNKKFQSSVNELSSNPKRIKCSREYKKNNVTEALSSIWHCYENEISSIRKEGKRSFCMEEIFQKYSDIIDLSNFQLGEYEKYEINITQAECTNTEAVVKVKLSNTMNVTGLTFILSNDAASKRYSNYEAPSIGEEKEYRIPYEEPLTSVDKVVVMLILNEDEYSSHVAVGSKC